jgi:malate synthase
MEDAATAEISRSQLWQWRTAGTKLDDGRSLTGGLYTTIRDDELARLRGSAADDPHLADAAQLLDALVLDDEFTEFLTIPAGALLD